jgi:hypothetical protein
MLRLEIMRRLHGPTLVSVDTKHREALLPPAPQFRDDLQAARRRPLDAPMAVDLNSLPPTRYDVETPPLGIGRMVLTGLLIAASFIGGIVVGRMV